MIQKYHRIEECMGTQKFTDRKLFIGDPLYAFVGVCPKQRIQQQIAESQQMIAENNKTVERN